MKKIILFTIFITVYSITSPIGVYAAQNNIVDDDEKLEALSQVFMELMEDVDIESRKGRSEAWKKR